MYETLDQQDAVFDAKGIETVRRDSCPAVSKILEHSLKLLFETRDISLIKQYVQRWCMKLVEGKASIQDFIFSKEYRGSFSYMPGVCVPALELTRKMLAYDRRSDPRVGERVPYIIIYGTPELPLIQLIRHPAEVLQDPTRDWMPLTISPNKFFHPWHESSLLLVLMSSAGIKNYQGYAGTVLVPSTDISHVFLSTAQYVSNSHEQTELSQAPYLQQLLDEF